MSFTHRRTAFAVVLAAGIVIAAAVPADAVAGVDVVGGPTLAGTGVLVQPGIGAAALPATAAESWVLADLTTGEVLAAKNPHRKGRPASTLKTLTAVTLLPVLDRNAQHVATYAQASAEGGHVGIVPGSSYSMWDLWHGLLLPSGNDAAAALAGANGGMKKTVLDMQAVAARLQAGDTTVRNPSGLDAPGQYTSAYDMALFAKAAMAIGDFRTLTKTISYDFPGRTPKGDKARKTYKIYTQNRLLLHGYRRTVAGKTGFTSKAHRTFWAAAQRGGHLLVVTLLQIGEPTETAAESLLTWGFANGSKVTPIGMLVDALPGSGAVTTPTDSSTPVAGSPDLAGSAAPVTATTGVRGWTWLLGLLLGGLGLVAVIRARRRRTSGDAATPSTLPASGGSTVLPVRPAAPAARTSPSVVVNTPGRRADSVAEPSPVLAAPLRLRDDTGPMPSLESPSASSSVDTSGDTAVEPALDRDSDPVAGPTPRTPGGHVRVIQPPRPGSS